MRRLVFFVAGFGAACGLLRYVDSPALCLTGFVAVALLCVLAGRKDAALHRGISAVLGCVLGVAWFCGYTVYFLRPLSPLDGEVVNCTIRAADYSRETDYGLAVDGTAEIAGKLCRVTAYLDETEPLEPGGSVTGGFRLRVTTDAGENPSSYYSGKGIFLLAYQTDTISRVQTPQIWRDIPAKLRHRISGILQACIPEDCEPFARALLLGDTSELSYETDTALKVSGIRHVVAVSGLHISVLFGLVSFLTLRRRVLSALVGIPLLALFAAVAGFTPSVSRACVMMSLMLLSQMINREYDGPTALSFAVLVMLMKNPYVISSVSFQLSVASVIGILAFAPGLRGWMLSRLGTGKGRGMGLLKKASAGVAVTVSAQILTVPLCAYYFGMVSLVGVLTNPLVLWAVSIIFLGLVAVCLTAAFPVSGIIGSALAVLIRYVLLVAKTLSSFPLAAVYTVSPYIAAWLSLIYLLLLLFFLCGKRLPLAFVSTGALCLCIALTASWLGTEPEDVVFSMLDVGQGQCLLLQTQGKTIMVDCGGDSDRTTADRAAETLLSQGFSRIDALIVTHPDRDHAGAVENFLSRIPAGVVILPPDAQEMSVPEGTKTVCAASNLLLTAGDAKLSIFAPVYRGSDNEMSLCVLFESENCDILITGDRDRAGEWSLLRNASLPDVDILVAGHHGSQYATSEELLQAVTPEIVCISAGAGNPYGHPAQETLKRLSDFGCTVYRTDLQGTITIRR